MIICPNCGIELEEALQLEDCPVCGAELDFEEEEDLELEEDLFLICLN